MIRDKDGNEIPSQGNRTLRKIFLEYDIKNHEMFLDLIDICKNKEDIKRFINKEIDRMKMELGE